jgi:hypothetical protein
MSATMTQEDINLVCSKFGVKQYGMLCGSLAWRQTLFHFKVKGDPAKSIQKDGARLLASQLDKQQLWYCNSRTSAEGAILEEFLRCYLTKVGSQIL